MLSILALTIKKTITLFVLMGPVSMIPVFLAATEGFDLPSKGRFARAIGLSVTVALLVATFLGMPILRLLGVSLGAVGWIGGMLPLALTVALTALELLVAFLQAYVFAILTCIYLNDAIHPGH